jgi:hypothetical protein
LYLLHSFSLLTCCVNLLRYFYCTVFTAPFLMRRF